MATAAPRPWGQMAERSGGAWGMWMRLEASHSKLLKRSIPEQFGPLSLIASCKVLGLTRRRGESTVPLVEEFGFVGRSHHMFPRHTPCPKRREIQTQPSAQQGDFGPWKRIPDPQ